MILSRESSAHDPNYNTLIDINHIAAQGEPNMVLFYVLCSYYRFFSTFGDIITKT